MEPNYRLSYNILRYLSGFYVVEFIVEMILASLRSNFSLFLTIYKAVPIILLIVSWQFDISKKSLTESRKNMIGTILVVVFYPLLMLVIFDLVETTAMFPILHAVVIQEKRKIESIT